MPQTDEPVSPFRDVWTALGHLRERPEVLDSPEAHELARLLADAILKAETEWQVARRGPGEN